MSASKTRAVFSVRTDKSGMTRWIRAGKAFTNRDGSINIHLDMLPLDGKLHIREVHPDTFLVTEKDHGEE